jgi:fatty-acyl-CoA synthase
MDAGERNANGLPVLRGRRDEPPLLEITIGEALDLAVARWGEADAVVSRPKGAVELARAGAACDEMAAGSSRWGLQPGDRIGIWSPNCANGRSPNLPPPGSA